VLAAHVLGLDEVPCIVLAHLTPTQRRAYVLADNKLALEFLLESLLGRLAGVDCAADGSAPPHCGSGHRHIEKAPLLLYLGRGADEVRRDASIDDVEDKRSNTAAPGKRCFAAVDSLQRPLQEF
jgi:hypothetical protein